MGADKAYMGAALAALEAVCQNYGYVPAALIMQYQSKHPDTQPRESLCQCHWEEGDSPCPIHKSPDDEELADATQDFLDYMDPRDDPDRAI